MLAFSSCLQPFQRPLGRRAELQEQVPWDEVVSASAPSRFSPRAASRGPGALGARSLALEVYLLWASRSAKSRRNARAVWCSRQRSRSGPASAIVMRNQEIESSVGAAQEEDAGEDQDTKQKLLQRLRQEVSGSHQLVARIFLSASSDLRHEMLELIAEETMALPVENFRGLLRALRKADVSPENIVQLYQRVQPWFMEQKPNEEDWAQVVYALARSGRLSEAADMVECMERGKEGFPAPDSRMYVLLVREMARQKGPFAASTLLSRTQAQGLIPDAVYFLLMVVVYSSATPPQLDRAKLYLRKGEELMRRQKFDFRMEVAEPLYLYTALMAGYSRLGRFRDTFSVLGILRQRKIRLSAVTFSILQRCCFSRLDAATDVRQLLRIMEQMGVTPETDNYNHLIEHLNLVLQGLLQLAGYTSCYGQSGQMTLALQVANRMREAGISWNQITYLKLIKAVVASGQVELALRLLTRMRSDGVRPGAPHYTCAFICLAREGYYEDASRVFQRLVELGGAKDPFAWNMMMAIECRRGDMDAAMEVLESMKEAGWPPNITSYSIMLEGYMGISDWPSALALRDNVLDLRQSLIRIAKDPVATEAAASAAKLELNLTATWTKVYHLLVDAAVYNAEWTRGVAFIEELTELGLPVNYYKHARRTVKTARQHACPTPKKRAAEPRPPPTKPPKVPEAPKPATNSPTMESDPVDHRQLFRRLLGMPRKKALKELEQLSEETLNAFAEFLDSEEAEQILCEPLVLALKDLPKPRKPRKPKARKKKSEKITKAKQKQPVNTDTPSAATAGAARPLLKGISRNRRDGSYQARICFNNFMTAAQYVNNLDVAVDIHISLVQMRQHAAASLAEGKEFGQVMHDAIEAIQKERATAGAVKLRLRFRSFFRNKFTRTEGNLDKAIQDWTRIRQEKDSFAGRVRGMEAERKQDETQKREARAARAAARMEQLRQMSERREAKLMARQRRQEALRRKRLAYARVKHGNLRTMILVLQTRFQKIRRKKMLKDWGVPELPEGLQLNSFQSADDSLCATLRLSDGTDAVGPYRKNFQEALRELQELRALQQLRGDKVLCQEMQRRDLEAMTAFFVQSIR